MIDTVEDYISGNITVDQALGKLRYTSPNNQICILSQSLLDKYLRFVDSERLMIYEKGGRYERARLWRKVARIIMRLAERLQISPERALAIFYDTRTCSMLHDSKYGLHLMSDDYILNDLLRELGDRQ